MVVGRDSDHGEVDSVNDHAAQHQPADLAGLATELLTQAGSATARRASRTLISGAAQRATLTALLKDAELGEHFAPPAASLQVISGEVELSVGERRQPIRTGELVAVPRQRHGLHALTDAVILLTVAVD